MMVSIIHPGASFINLEGLQMAEKSHEVIAFVTHVGVRGFSNAKQRLCTDQKQLFLALLIKRRERHASEQHVSYWQK